MRSTYPYTIINFKMATDLEHKGNVWLNWSWDDLYWTPNLDHWEIWPSYSYVDTNGSTRWMDMGSESLDQTNPSAREWSYYWELPLSAEEVYFRLRPIAKNKSDGSPEWEEEFYTTEKKYFGGATKPDKPSAPSVTQRSTLGIQVVLSLTNVLEPENNKNVVKAEFQTIQYDNEFDTGVILNTVQGYVDDFGNIQAYTQIGTSYGYKFRVRLWGSKARTEDPNQVTVVSSDWSELTSEFTMGAPEQPQLKVTKFSNDKVQLEILTNAIPHHFQYEIAPSTSVFDAVDEWERENPSIKEDSEARTAALLSLGIIDEQTKEGTVKKFTIPVPASGQDFAVYRVRSVSSDENAFYSSWSDVTEDSTLIFSDGLRAPIIWSSSEFAEVGDPSMQLCIMHNSPNGSPACRCQIGWSVNRETANEHWEWLNPPSGQSGNTVFYYNLDISAFDEETVIYWKARTFEGNVPIEENSSPMSEIKHFAIHAKPDVQLIFPDLSEVEEHDYPVMTSYPLKYRTQTTYYDSVTNPIEIISYEFNIISAQTYRRFDKEGRLQVIKAGDVIWNYLDTSKYYDVDRLLTAADCTLDNGVLYYFQVTVALSNGSTGNNSYRDERDIYHPGKEFMVSLESEEYTIQCNHTINRDTVALYLSPYAVKYEGTGLLPTPSFEDEYWVPSYIGGSLGATYPGDRVWHVGDKTYYSSGSDQYEFNRESNEWIPKTWNGLTSFNGANTWSDGENVYYSFESDQYMLNVDTDTWVPKTWYGLTSFISWYIWSDGTDIYYSNANESQQYVLNKETNTWTLKTWNGYSSVKGNYIWTDGESFYFSIQTGSSTATHYILDAQTSTWSIKTWEGNSFFTGDRVWTDGYNVYVSSDLYGFDSNQYKLNKDTDTWESITWEVHDGPSTYSVNLYAGRMWKDNGVVYLSNNGLNIKLEGIPQESQELVPTYPSNVELAVYRKNDDGSFVKIDDDIPNTQSLFITDPHPNLAGAEYRIVGTDMDSGKMTYYDPPPIDMGCTDIILQWDEDYANKPDNGDLRDFIPNLGNIVRLPYNIDVSESANIDNEMVKYVGRKDPVSYYGTQTGYTASWSTEIPKYDKDTIKMLRKLQVYPGDVYVREPNGTGYWAHVTVTFPLNHCALSVSVSINVTRVEGGK